MSRLVTGLYSFFFALLAFAEDVKDAPPPDHTDVMGIVIFFGLFIGLCVGFFAYMYWRHKNNKED